MHEFGKIIADYALISNTTWDARQGPTFHDGHNASRIDHVFCSQDLHDARAKHSVYLNDAPFLPTDGPIHVPILCTIKKTSVLFSHYPTSKVTYQNKLKGREAWYNMTPDWHAFAHDTREAIGHMQPSTHHCPIDSLHTKVIDAFRAHFSIKPPDKECTVHVGMVKAKWHHRSQMQTIQCAGMHPSLQLKDILCRWMHAARFSRLKKMHTAWVHFRKKQIVETIIDDADRAAQPYDSFRLFQSIHKLTPKTRKRRVHL